MIRTNCKLAAAVAVMIMPVAAKADNLTTTVTNAYGMPGGLIDMPTAEMAPEGQLSTTVSAFDGTTKTTLGFQVTKRLSAAFRYSAIDGLVAQRETAPGSGVFVPTRFTPFYDRSFDLKFLLLKEAKYRPAVAIGLRDGIGTGLFGGEYIVATKSIGERVRLTGGIGWGRLGSFGAFGSTGTRATDILGEGGIPTFDRWFQGDVAAFAGASFKVTDRLNLKVEYSSDGYDLEERDGIIKHRTPFNFGVDYAVNENLRLSAYSLHGDTVGVSLSFGLNARKPAVRGGAEAAPVPVAVRSASARSDLGWTIDQSRQAGVRATLRSSLAQEGLKLHALDLQGKSAHVMIRNPRFNIRSQAVGRTARIMTRVLPASVETLTITQVVEGIPSSSVTLRRSDLERLENAPAANMLQAATFSDPVAVGTPGALEPDAYPRFDWRIGPFLQFSVFDPDNPVRVNGGIQAKTRFHFAPGWVADSSVSVKLFGDLDNVVLRDPSKLPNVRSNVALYSQTDDPTVDYLTVANYSRPARNIYSRVTLGYLEKMYAGASAEVLWKPVDSAFGLGAEVNYVQPRDFDQLFGLRTRTTPGGTIPEFNGHLSAYYDFGNGFHGQLDAGRYLAGDWGATVSIDRVFANGWRVGAYATKTDVSSEAFGEGSFDKGIRISIPLAWGIGSPTQLRTDTNIRSLSRDGGARLNVNGRLYDTIRDTHKPEMAKSWGKFWR